MIPIINDTRALMSRRFNSAVQRFKESSTWACLAIFWFLSSCSPGQGLGPEFASTSPGTTPAQTLPPPRIDPVIVAAGDIACPSDSSTYSSCQQIATSDLILQMDPVAVLALGDLQYYRGDLEDYLKYYDPSWGRFREITYPVLGNHDSGTGFFDYFHGAGNFGDSERGYYSYDLGAWHLVALNSNCADVGGCETGSPQEQWLREDLASSSHPCTLAYWHHSYYTSGTRGGTREVKPFVQALYGDHADLLLVAHNHFYERFAPQDPDGKLDLVQGIREIIVGTGGRSLPVFGRSSYPNSEAFGASSFGVLKVTLRPLSYDWEFVPVAGYSFVDSGTSLCH